MNYEDGVPDILAEQYVQDPYSAHRLLRERFPVAWHAGTGSYLLSRHEDVKRAFYDTRFSSKNYEWQLEPVQGRSVHQMEGHEHSAYRKLLNPALRAPGVEAMRSAIESNARDLIGTWLARGEVDLVGEFARVFPLSVMLSLFDIPKSDRERVHAWFSAWMAFLGNLSADPDAEAAGLRARDEFRAYAYPMIEERRRHPGNDLLSHLCTSELEPGVKLDDETIVALFGNLMTAGAATTDKAIASLMRNLLENPSQLKAVRSDRTLLRRAFAETLRHSSPVQMVMRTTIEEVEVSGDTIPRDALVTCLIASANRDERVFAEADRFDIFREDLDFERAFVGAANHLGFCWGRHFCAGALLARADVEIGVGALLDAMDAIEFCDGRPPTEVGIFLRAPSELRVRFRPSAGWQGPDQRAA